MNEVPAWVREWQRQRWPEQPDTCGVSSGTAQELLDEHDQARTPELSPAGQDFLQFLEQANIAGDEAA